MTLPESFPPAFLALWNDIDPVRDAEYERWHSLEHVPERVWTPGVIAGTRYVATRSGQARYFTLYDLESLAALKSAAYQELVDHPTPWSASMRPAFANFLRKPCGETVASVATAADATAAALLVMRVVFAAAQPATAMTRLTEAVLAEVAGRGVAWVRAGRVDTAGPQAMTNCDDAPVGDEWVLLVHAIDPDRLPGIDEQVVATLNARMADFAANVASNLAAHSSTPPWHTSTHYRLLGRVDHADVAQASRPAPRLDLMPATPIG